MKSTIRNKGLTVIEIVIILAIGGILFAVVLAASNHPKPQLTANPLGESDRMAFVQEFNQYSASSTSSKVAVGNTSTLLLATSTTGYRKYVRFTNLGSTVVFLSVGTAAIDQMGIALYASSTYEIAADRNPFLQAVYAISSTSPTNVAVLEKI